MADRLFFITEDPDEAEYTGKEGPTSVPIRKILGAGGGQFHPGEGSLSASDKLRLDRLAGHRDPRLPLNRRIWNGETEFRTAAQIEGDRRNDLDNPGT